MISGYAATSNGGLEENNDSYIIFDFGDWLVAGVCDGSAVTDSSINTGQIAVVIIRDYFNRLKDKVLNHDQMQKELEHLAYTLSRIYLSINGMSENFSSVCTSMGLVVVEKISLRGFVMNIGSTEIQLIRNGQYSRICDLHTVAYDELKKGEIAENELYHHPKRAILTSALGVFNEPVIDLKSMTFETNDILLLSTDGIFRVTSPEGIIQDLAENSEANKSMKECVDLLIKKTESYDPQDNVTLCVLNLAVDTERPVRTLKQRQINQDNLNRIEKALEQPTGSIKEKRADLLDQRKSRYRNQNPNPAQYNQYDPFEKFRR